MPFFYTPWLFVNFSIVLVVLGNNKYTSHAINKIILKYNIACIITSNPIKFSLINKLAIENKLTIYQSFKLESKKIIYTLTKLNPDIQLVVAFRILPRSIYTIPTIGSINLHASLLPEYRGAAPIQRSIMYGAKKTGVTTFLINHTIDTGNIILQKKITIKYDDTYEYIKNKLLLLGSKLIIETFKVILKYKLIPFTQVYKYNIKLAPKIFRIDAHINLSNKIDTIYNKIRGLSPYPGAWTKIIIESKLYIYKIYKVKCIINRHNKKIALIDLTNINMNIYVTGGYLSINQAQIEGKNKMYIKHILNGIKKKKCYILN